MNCIRLETRIQQLPPVGFRQIEMDAGAKIAVTWRASGQEQHGVFLLDRIEIEDLLKQFLRVGELRLKFHSHFFSNREAAMPDSGTDSSGQILRTTVELSPHAAHSTLGNASQCPAPAGVEGCDDSLPKIGDQDGETIRSLNSKQDARRSGDKTIAAK